MANMYPGYNRYGGAFSNWSDAGDGNAVMPLPTGAMGGAQRLPMFGSGDVSGQAAHNFEVRLRVAATALQNSGSGYQNRKKVQEVVQYIISHMEAGGTAYTWGQQIGGVLRGRYLNHIQQYLMDPEIQDATYADRCQAVAGTFHYDDLNHVEPTTGVSLKHILLGSHVEFLRHNEYMLDERPAATPAAAASSSEGEGSQRPAGQAAAAAVQDLYLRAWRQVNKATRADAMVPSGMPPYRRPALPALPAAAAGAAAAPFGGPGAPRQPRLVEELPWGPEAPSGKTLAGLQAYEAQWMGDKGSAAIPMIADYVCEGFRGEFVAATGDELRELQGMQPQGRDTPMVYRTKLMGAWERAGGKRVWPTILLIDTYMAGLLQGYPIVVHNAVQREIESRFNNQKENINIVSDLCPVAMAAYDGLKEVAARKQLVQSRARGGGQLGMGGRNQGVGQGAGGSRGGQQYGQASRQRAAHAALAYGGEEPQYQAYAAQHTEVAPHTYNVVPPPMQHQQAHYHQGGSSRSKCGKCGGSHAGVCYVEAPERAHASWVGPHSQEAYIKYVENCAKAKPNSLQPVRYKFKVVGDWPKHVKEYLKKMGVREPERPRVQAQPRQQGGYNGLGSGYMAQATGHGSHYPSLEETFRSATMLHEEEEEAAEYYSCWYVESVDGEHEEPAEALLSTRASSKLLAAATEQAAKRQAQAKAPAAGSSGEGSRRAAASKGSSGVGGGQAAAGDSKKGKGPPAAAEPGSLPLPAPAASHQLPAEGSGADRPPLPAPVAARRQLPAERPGVGGSDNPAVAASPADEPEAGQPAAPRALPGGRAPPLPFTLNPIPAGTPPAQYPQPVARFGKAAAGTPQQVAVARGSIMQQLPVCVGLQQLARQLPGDALKQLLLRSDIELTLMQHSVAPGRIRGSDIAVNFSSIAEVLRVAQAPQAFTAESLGGVGGRQGEGAGDQGEGVGGVEGQGEGLTGQGGESGSWETLQSSIQAGGSQEDQHAAWDAAAAEQQQVGVLVAAMCAAERAAAEAAAFNTVSGTSGSECGAFSRPTAYQLLAHSEQAPGITISLCDSDGKANELQGLDRLIFDSGADIALMGEHCAQRNKVPMAPSDRRIRTSSGQVTGTLSKVAAQVKYVLRKGEPGECVVYQDTYVMPGSGAMYDFLLGTPLINKWGMFVDPISSIATYRPHWHSQKDSHTLAHVPVLTSVDELPAEASPGGSSQAQTADGCSQQAAAMQQGATSTSKAEGGQGLGGSKGGEAAVAADVVTSQPAAGCSNTAVYEPPTSFMIVSV